MIPPVFGREGVRNYDKGFVLKSLAADISRYRPVVIALDKTPLPTVDFGEIGLDEFFAQAAFLKDSLKDYRRAGEAGVFVLFERNDFTPATKP